MDDTPDYPSPSEFDHYSTYIAQIAGRLVESDHELDVLLDQYAQSCTTEYGLSDREKRRLYRYVLFETDLPTHVFETVGVSDRDWILDSTYHRDTKYTFPPELYVVLDIVVELRDIVAQRFCEQRTTDRSDRR